MNSNTSGRRSAEIVRGPQPRTAPPPAREPLARADAFIVHTKIVDRETRQPMSRTRYEVLDAQGNPIAEGTTDWQGIVRHSVAQGGRYTVRVKEVPPQPLGGAGG